MQMPRREWKIFFGNEFSQNRGRNIMFSILISAYFVFKSSPTREKKRYFSRLYKYQRTTFNGKSRDQRLNA